MKLLRKITFIIIIYVISAILIGGTQSNISIGLSVNVSNPARVAVLLFNFDDPYKSLIRKSLEKIQKENESKVNFTFFDSKSNQATQNEIIDSLVTSNFDLLLVNVIDTSEGAMEDIIIKSLQLE